MSQLAKQIIDRMLKEQDMQLIAEVLDFYEYLKYKKQNKLEVIWEDIAEDEPTNEEKSLIDQYKVGENEFVDFHSLVQELNADDK